MIIFITLIKLEKKNSLSLVYVKFSNNIFSYYYLIFFNLLSTYTIILKHSKAFFFKPGKKIPLAREAQLAERSSEDA